MSKGWKKRFSDEVLNELKEMGYKDIHFSDLLEHAQAIQILLDRIEEKLSKTKSPDVKFKNKIVKNKRPQFMN